eukprot:1395368-Amorphochlora_amoeboformis.AAC.3
MEKSSDVNEGDRRRLRHPVVEQETNGHQRIRLREGQISVSDQRLRSASQIRVSDQLLTSASQISVSDQRLRSVSQISVSDQRLRSASHCALTFSRYGSRGERERALSA